MIQEPKITVKKQAKTLSHSKATASRSEGNEVPKLGPPPSATSPAVSKSMKANRPKTPSQKNRCGKRYGKQDAAVIGYTGQTRREDPTYRIPGVVSPFSSMVAFGIDALYVIDHHPKTTLTFGSVSSSAIESETSVKKDFWKKRTGMCWLYGSVK